MVGNFLSAQTSHRWVCEDIAELLETRGWDVYRTSGSVNRVFRIMDMSCRPFWWRRRYGVATVDVFSRRSFYWAEAAARSLRMLRKPHVLVLRGGGLDDFLARNPHRVRRLLGAAAAVVTPSRRLAGIFRTVRADVGYLPNGIVLSRYPFRLRKRPAAHMCWLRAIDNIYNPAMAVRAVALLAAEFPEMTLDLYGRVRDTKALQLLREEICRLGMHERVRILGPVPKQQVPRVLPKYEVFLNTTDFESYGVSMMEAAACGLCLVSTDAGELPYLWENGRNALLVPRNDAEAMAAAVRRFLTNPELAEHLSANARCRAEEFDWAIVLPRWEQLLVEVAERGGL